MSDSTGLLILAGAALMWMHSSAVPSTAAPPGVPNTEREMDPTRWRHDGTQPLVWTKGNGASFVDETVRTLQGNLLPG